MRILNIAESFLHTSKLLLAHRQAYIVVSAPQVRRLGHADFPNGNIQSAPSLAWPVVVMCLCHLSGNYLNQLLNVAKLFCLGSRNLTVALKGKPPTGCCMSACHRALQPGIFLACLS